MYKKHLKRLIDVVLSCIALIMLLPLMAIIALLVRIKLGSPVIFKQIRPGKKGMDGKEKLFSLYKFRSMTDEKDSNKEFLSDEKRLIRFGQKLRLTSLDELPELINIIKGDMSLVGPRPLLVRDIMFMTDVQRQRHNIRPGLSGWAQVNGRNCIKWESKLSYDLEYLDRMSFWFDTKIILITIIKVIKTESIISEGKATAEDLGDYLLRMGKVGKNQYDIRQEDAKKLLGEYK